SGPKPASRVSLCHNITTSCPRSCSRASCISRSQFEPGKTTTPNFIDDNFLGPQRYDFFLRGLSEAGRPAARSAQTACPGSYEIVHSQNIRNNQPVQDIGGPGLSRIIIGCGMKGGKR